MANLVSIQATGSNMRRLPEGLANLRCVEVGGAGLAEDWLPAAIAATVCMLKVSGPWSRFRLPEGMVALHELWIEGVGDLEEDWLPLSSTSAQA